MLYIHPLEIMLHIPPLEIMLYIPPSNRVNIIHLFIDIDITHPSNCNGVFVIEGRTIGYNHHWMYNMIPSDKRTVRPHRTDVQYNLVGWVYNIIPLDGCIV